MPLPHPLLPLWRESFNLDFLHIKRRFRQTAHGPLVVCLDVAINLLLPANGDLSQGSAQKSNTEQLHLQSDRAERFIQSEHHKF